MDWLNSNREFASGVKLYADHGGKAFFLTMFANAGPTDYNKNKLVVELTKLAGADVAVSETKPVPAAARTTNPAAQTPPSLQPSPDARADNRRYLDLSRRKNDLYTQLNMLLMEKRFLPAGEKLRICAFDIIKTHQAIMENWALLDYFQEHQCFPTGPSKPKRDPKVEKQYLLQAISKAKKRLQNPKCRDRTATELLLKAKEAELAELNYRPKE